LARLTEKHDIAETEVLVDAGASLTALSRHDLSGHLNYHDRNHIGKWFQTVTMRIDRFHSFRQGSHSSTKRWLRRFRHYYDRNRPNQALDGPTPAEEVLD
jgi:putative transposase